MNTKNLKDLIVWQKSYNLNYIKRSEAVENLMKESGSRLLNPIR